MAFQTRVAMLAPNAGFQCPEVQLAVDYGIRCVAPKTGFDFNL